MSLAQDIAILRKIPMLSDFAEDQLRLLAFSAENLDYRDGQSLFEQEERADGGFVVMQGNVSLQTRDADGFSEVGQAGPGTLIGETALLVDTKRPCRAQALGPVRILRIRRALFKRMIQEYPELARNIFEKRASHFRHTASALRPVGDKMADLEALAASRRRDRPAGD